MRTARSFGLGLLCLALGPGATSGGELSLQSAQRRLDRLEAALDGQEKELDLDLDALDEIQRRPQASVGHGVSLSGRLEGAWRDLAAYGLGDHHSSAFNIGFFLRVEAKVGSAAKATVGLGRARPDDDLQLVSPAGSAGTSAKDILHELSLKLEYGWMSQTFGAQYLFLSPMTVSGKLSLRPQLFDRNPYASKTPTRALFESQFISGSPHRAEEEAEQALMGWQGSLHLPADLQLLAFFSDQDGFYSAPSSAIHQYGGSLSLSHELLNDGKLSLVAVNQSNDSGELRTVGGSSAGGAMGADFLNGNTGLQNNTLLSAYSRQTLVGAPLALELARSNFDNPWLHLQGTAASASLEWPLGPLALELKAYQVEPDFMNLAGKLQGNGFNDPALQYSQTAGRLDHETNIADPSLPMENTRTWSLGSRVSFHKAYLSFRLQNAEQIQATSAYIQSAHVLNGGNLDGGSWWSLFSNSTSAWDPASGSNNPRADAYNRASYRGPVAALDGSRTYDGAYRQLNADHWRSNREEILASDPASGLALPFSRKSISTAWADLRGSLSDAMGIDTIFFWQINAEFSSVADAPLAFPDGDPNHLLNQGTVSSTLVYNFYRDLSFLLNGGYEVWGTDRMLEAARLEYYERSAGTGIDYDLIPGVLSLYSRLKVFYHYDPVVGSGSFEGRQMSWELRSYF